MTFDSKPFRSLIWLVFPGLVACGNPAVFTNCDGEGICSVRIEAARYSGTLPLSPRSGFWDSPQGPQSVTIELGPQLITNPQWPNPSIKAVAVSAARTDTEIAIRLEWQDATADFRAAGTRPYTDQAAVLFPMERTNELPPITMGGEGQAVNIWIWKANRDPALTLPPQKEMQPVPGQAVEDLNAEGFSTLTRQGHQDVVGMGVRTETGWQVVFKRPLTENDDNDAQFVGSTPLAIAVWDGGNRETNGQKGISTWVFLNFS